MEIMELRLEDALKALRAIGRKIRVDLIDIREDSQCGVKFVFVENCGALSVEWSLTFQRYDRLRRQYKLDHTRIPSSLAIIDKITQDFEL